MYVVLPPFTCPNMNALGISCGSSQVCFDSSIRGRLACPTEIYIRKYEFQIPGRVCQVVIPFRARLHCATCDCDLFLLTMGCIGVGDVVAVA